MTKKELVKKNRIAVDKPKKEKPLTLRETVRRLDGKIEYRTHRLEIGHNVHDERIEKIERYLEAAWYKRIFMNMK